MHRATWMALGACAIPAVVDSFTAHEAKMPRTQSVRDGTVTVFVHDRAGGALLWRGTVEAEGKVGSNRAMVRKAVQFARDVVRQFPERKTTSASPWQGGVAPGHLDPTRTLTD